MIVQFREKLMQLSKGFDYAVRSLVFLALLSDGASAELRTIAESQNIPLSYLAKVMRNLVRGGLVSSTLGRDGGYCLRRLPEEITLMQVYAVIEGEMRLVECMEDQKNCMFFKGCTQVSVWHKLKNAVEEIFRETTLKDLLPQPTGEQRLTQLKEKERKYARAGA